MPQTYLIFADIEGKLDVLRVECTNATARARTPELARPRPGRVRIMNMPGR